MREIRVSLESISRVKCQTAVRKVMITYFSLFDAINVQVTRTDNFKMNLHKSPISFKNKSRFQSAGIQ